MTAIGIGNRLAPARFLAFILLLIVAVPAATWWLKDSALGTLLGFDVAAGTFLVSCAPLLWVTNVASIRDHAKANDANRTMLLVLTGIVMVVLLLTVAAETVGSRPQPFTKVLVVATLLIAWLFSNSIYALHYAHLGYGAAAKCLGLSFPGDAEPTYWDFVYFAFTLGMTFQTSDVEIDDPHIRRIVTMHCLAAFVFNIGVLAFTINVLGGS
jgi:uncharacterized membrane protein